MHTGETKRGRFWECLSCFAGGGYDHWYELKVKSDTDIGGDFLTHDNAELVTPGVEGIAIRARGCPVCGRQHGIHVYSGAGESMNLGVTLFLSTTFIPFFGMGANGVRFIGNKEQDAQDEPSDEGLALGHEPGAGDD